MGKYFVIAERNLDYLETKVNKAITIGAQLVGGVTVERGRDGFCQYMQAVYSEDPALHCVRIPADTVASIIESEASKE